MRTWSEISQRLYQGQAVVATVTEAGQQIQEMGLSQTVEQVDIVVTATFAPVPWAMVSFGPSLPPHARWIEQAWLAGVPLQTGFVPRHLLLHAQAETQRNPQRGGAHLLEAWLAGERLPLRLQLRPSAVHSQPSWEGAVGLSDLEQATLLVYLHSPPQGRVALNSQSVALPSEVGLLLPEMGNAAYTWAGPGEPGVLDPNGRAIVPGTPVLVAGSMGHVAWRQGPFMLLTADLHTARREYLRPLVIPGHGVGLAVGIAWALPVLDPQMLAPLLHPREGPYAEIVDYGATQWPPRSLERIPYGDLTKGQIAVGDRAVPLTSLISPTRSVRLAEELKQRLLRREFPPLSPPTAQPAAEE